MNARAKLIVSMLDTLFPEPAIPLRHTSPYTLLVAVLLSAQCTDERVNRVTPALFALADTPEAMMEQPVAEVQRIIRPCGLSERKAKAIVQLSRMVVEQYGGKVPRTLEALESLPGVGHKTASVVMVQVWGKPAFPVDTHIHRLAHRWGLADGKSVVSTERALKRAFPKRCWSKLHLQMIYYGRTYCKARGHAVARCPLCSALACVPHPASSR